MKDIGYLEIFKKAGQLTWKHKFLWWFGFFIFLGSLGGGFNFKKNQVVPSTQFQNLFLDFFQNHPVLIFSLLLGVLFLFLLLFVLRITAKASLIKTVGNLELYSKQPFKFLFKEGLAHLGTLVLFEILLAITVICLLLVLAVPVIFLLTLKAYFFLAIASLAALAIFIPTVVTAYFIATYVYLYRVLGNLKLLQATESAYFLFRANIKESLLMGIFSFALNILFLFGLLISLLLSVLTLGIIGILPYLFLGKTAVAILGLIGAFLLLILALATLSAWETFKQAAWTLFFQEITRTKAKEKTEKETLEGKETLRAGALG